MGKKFDLFTAAMFGGSGGNEGEGGGGESGGGSGGGGSIQPGAVTFIDYDGSILEVWETADVADKDALPQNPDHSSDITWGGNTIALTSQGWNWTLAQIKDYMASYPDAALVVGQMYETTDGALHLCVTMEAGRLSPTSQFTVTGGTATIDWGDGSDPVQAVSGADNAHTYADPGDYDIKISVTDGATLNISGSSNIGCALLKKAGSDGNGSRAYQSCVRAAYLSGSVTSIGNYAFAWCYSLNSMSVPGSVGSIGSNAFLYCYTLRGVSIPSGVTSLGTNAFQYCYAMSGVAIPNSVTGIGSYAFSYCYALQSVSIPGSVTNTGDYTFQYCYGLKNVTIPGSVTKIGSYAFQYCNSLQSVNIPGSVTRIYDYAFGNCASLQNVTLQNGLTAIGDYAFSFCASLRGVTVPGSVTSIGRNAFAYCYTLRGVNIPSGVTSLGYLVFASCYGLGTIEFQPQTPPTVQSNTFSSLPTDCIIYVPAGTLEAYTGATNYPSSSTYTYVEVEDEA